MTADPPTEHRNDADADVDRVPAGTARDRRRPARLERVSPALIGLLRSQPNPDTTPNEASEAGDELRPVRGILFAAALGLVMWAGLFWLVGDLLR